MRKTVLTILSVLLLITVVSAQSTINTQTASTVDTLLMKQIDLITQEINDNLDSYRKVVKLDDSTGHNYEYVKGNGLKAIVLEGTDPRDGNYKRVQWYLDKGKEIYSESSWTNASGKIVDMERVYINNDKLIAWYNSGKWVDSNSPMFKQLAEQATDYAVSLATIANEVK